MSTEQKDREAQELLQKLSKYHSVNHTRLVEYFNKNYAHLGFDNLTDESLIRKIVTPRRVGELFYEDTSGNESGGGIFTLNLFWCKTPVIEDPNYPMPTYAVSGIYMEKDFMGLINGKIQLNTEYYNTRKVNFKVESPFTLQKLEFVKTVESGGWESMVQGTVQRSYDLPEKINPTNFKFDMGAPDSPGISNNFSRLLMLERYTNILDSYRG